MMSFENTYSAVFMVYRLLGLVPFPYHFKSITSSQNIELNSRNFFGHKQKWNLTLEILYFICVLALELSILVLSCLSCYLHTVKNDLNLFNASHMVIVFALRVFFVAATVETYFKRNLQVKILINLYEIDRVFARELNLSIDYHPLKRQILVAFLKFMIAFVVAFVIFARFAVVATDPYPIYIRLSYAFYPLIKAALVGSKYITYATLIHYRIEAMHGIFDSFEIGVDKQSNHDDELFEFRCMIHLRWIYSRIYDTVQMANDSFEWTISMGFSVALIDSSLMLFHAFDDIFEPSKRSTILTSFNWIPFFLHHLFFMGMIIKAANRIGKQAKSVAHKVHLLGSRGQILDDLHNFVSSTAILFLIQ